MEKLTFTIDSDIYENIVNGKQKAFVTNIKPSEIHNYFYFTEDKSINVKYFNIIEFITKTTEGIQRSCQFKIGFAEIDFLVPNSLLDKANADLTTLYDCDHLPPAEISFELREALCFNGN